MNLEMMEFKREIAELKRVRARHTTLVSVLIPVGYPIRLISNQLAQEMSTAQNIKSKQTRKDVLAALDKIMRRLKTIKTTPTNGLAIYSGDDKLWLIAPLKPLGLRKYICAQTFLTGPLEEMTKATREYGLIVIGIQEATIGILSGKRVEALETTRSLVEGKSKPGGQSQQRYKRVRENLIKSFFKETWGFARSEFKDRPIKGIIVGGPGPTKENFIQNKVGGCP